MEDLAAALMEGLRRHLMPQARPGALTPEEVERAESLRLKYLSDEWNFMR